MLSKGKRQSEPTGEDTARRRGAERRKQFRPVKPIGHGDDRCLTEEEFLSYLASNSSAARQIIGNGLYSCGLLPNVAAEQQGSPAGARSSAMVAKPPLDTRRMQKDGRQFGSSPRQLDRPSALSPRNKALAPTGLWTQVPSPEESSLWTGKPPAGKLEIHEQLNQCLLVLQRDADTLANMLPAVHTRSVHEQPAASRKEFLERFAKRIYYCDELVRQCERGVELYSSGGNNAECLLKVSTQYQKQQQFIDRQRQLCLQGASEHGVAKEVILALEPTLSQSRTSLSNLVLTQDWASAEGV